MPRKPIRAPEPRKCARCDAEFYPIVRQIRKGLGLFCSRRCAATDKNHRPPPLLTVEERFWRHVDKDGPLPADESLGSCWLWTGSVGGTGRWAYGKLGKTKSSGMRLLYAHRVSYELHRGPIPEGSLVCHRCDVPACVNPDHLFLGSAADNSHDMREKARHPTARFNREKVDEARRLHAAGRSINWLAQKYGASRGTMSKVLNGGSWKGPPEKNT